MTGATSGIGLATARALAGQGCSLALVGRDPGRLRATVDELRTQSTAPVEGYLADLTRRGDIARVAGEIQRAHPRLSILINDAGGLFLRRLESSDGVERTLALNLVAPFVLTQALLPQLRAGAPSRVVNVASAAHASGRIRLDDLEGRRHFGGWRAYAQSKLALILLTQEFARREGQSGVTFNSCHPGFVRSRFGQGNGRFASGTIQFLAWMGGISSERGARVVVRLATSPEVVGRTGEYFVKTRAVRLRPKARDPEMATALWSTLESFAQSREEVPSGSPAPSAQIA